VLQFCEFQAGVDVKNLTSCLKDIPLKHTL